MSSEFTPAEIKQSLTPEEQPISGDNPAMAAALALAPALPGDLNAPISKPPFVHDSYTDVLWQMHLKEFLEQIDLKKRAAAQWIRGFKSGAKGESPKITDVENRQLMLEMDKPAKDTILPAVKELVPQIIRLDAKNARAADLLEQRLEARDAALDATRQEIAAAIAAGEAPDNVAQALQDLERQKLEQQHQLRELQQLQTEAQQEVQKLQQVLLTKDEQWQQFYVKSLNDAVKALQQNGVELSNEEQAQFKRQESFDDLFKRYENERGGKGLSDTRKEECMKEGLVGYIKLKTEIATQGKLLTEEQQEKQSQSRLTVLNPTMKEIRKEADELRKTQEKESSDQLKVASGAYDGVQAKSATIGGAAQNLAEQAKELREAQQKKKRQQEKELEEAQRKKREQEELQKQQQQQSQDQSSQSNAYVPPGFQ